MTVLGHPTERGKQAPDPIAWPGESGGIAIIYDGPFRFLSRSTDKEGFARSHHSWLSSKVVVISSTRHRPRITLSGSTERVSRIRMNGDRQAATPAQWPPRSAVKGDLSTGIDQCGLPDGSIRARTPGPPWGVPLSPPSSQRSASDDRPTHPSCLYQETQKNITYIIYYAPTGT